MKSFIKLVVFVFVFALLALTLPPVRAQSYSLQPTIINGGTNTVAATTTNTYSVVMPVTRSSFIGIQPVFSLTGAGSSAVVFRLDESLDNSTWTSASQSLSITASTTNTVTGIKNFSANGVGYIRLSSIENPNANAITNLVIKFTTKNGL